MSQLCMGPGSVIPSKAMWVQPWKRLDSAVNAAYHQSSWNLFVSFNIRSLLIISLTNLFYAPFASVIYSQAGNRRDSLRPRLYSVDMVSRSWLVAWGPPECSLCRYALVFLGIGGCLISCGLPVQSSPLSSPSGDKLLPATAVNVVV